MTLLKLILGTLKDFALLTKSSFCWLTLSDASFTAWAAWSVFSLMFWFASSIFWFAMSFTPSKGLVTLLVCSSFVFVVPSAVAFSAVVVSPTALSVVAFSAVVASPAASSSVPSSSVPSSSVPSSPAASSSAASSPAASSPAASSSVPSSSVPSSSVPSSSVPSSSVPSSAVPSSEVVSSSVASSAEGVSFVFSDWESSSLSVDTWSVWSEFSIIETILVFWETVFLIGFFCKSCNLKKIKEYIVIINIIPKKIKNLSLLLSIFYKINFHNKYYLE